MRTVRFLLALACAIAATGAAIAAGEVDLLLVIASDASHSIDDAKFKLQRDGYIAAISDFRVIEAIRSGPRKRIAICFVEWSGITEQNVVVDWTVIDDEKTAMNFVNLLRENPRSFASYTSISGAIDFAMANLARAPFYSERRTIDVSGDGTNNSGRSVVEARDDAVAQGVTINGLVILSEQPMYTDPLHTHPPGGLEMYYRTKVIGGPNAFVMVAENFQAFGQAIVHKLLVEIAESSGTTLRRFGSLRARNLSSQRPPFRR